jgi:hypothetical protein
VRIPLKARCPLAIGIVEVSSGFVVVHEATQITKSVKLYLYLQVLSETVLRELTELWLVGKSVSPTRITAVGDLEAKAIT